MSEITLYDYWRSSASYRVRIALGLKKLPFKTKFVDLSQGDQRSEIFRKLNPQGLVPAIEIDGLVITQSLAIIEYLDYLQPDPRLVPGEPLARARVQGLSYLLAMEIHPVCNLRVVNQVVALADGDDRVRKAWMKKHISSGLQAFETSLNNEATGTFCHGDTVSMADCCLIAQLYNAKRWGANYTALERIGKIETACQEIPAFLKAYPKEPG